MPKFKEKDFVLILSNKGQPFYDKWVGHVGFIKRVLGGDDYTVVFPLEQDDDEDCLFFENELEKINLED